jgi:Cu-Zn family superoxide dismutase
MTRSMNRSFALLTTLALSAALAACTCPGKHGDHGPGPGGPGAPPPPPAMPRVGKAQATIKGNAANKKIKGQVVFTQVDQDVLVVADIDGLKKNTDHGIHIHEFGDCSAPDLTSAGGHYNPMGAPHGGPDAPAHHAGDLGNLTSDAKGHAHLEETIKGMILAGPNQEIPGRSVIVHEGKDDYMSQPAGNSGNRIACGAINLMKAN